MSFKSIFLHGIIFTAICFTGCQGPTTKTIKPNDASVELEAAKQREIALQEALHSHIRLNRVGFPILKAGLPLCKDRVTTSNIGIAISNKYEFDDEYRDTAMLMFDLGEPLKLIHVYKNSPAEAAGLKKGDVIISLNGEDSPTGNNARKKFIKSIRDESKENSNLSFKVRRGQEDRIISVATIETCDYPLSVSGDTSVNAYADGNQIVFHQGMMDFAKDDNELALVIGHELAHNSMRHIDAKRINALGGFLVDLLFAALGANTQGAFTKMAAQAYSQEFEAEADYVGLYINELAGYDISDAQYFWRRMGVKHPGAIDKNHAASHPSTPERFVAIEESVKEIEAKKIAGEVLMPNIDDEVVAQRDPPPEAVELGFK